MNNLGFQELLLIAVLALIVFGPERLPELARRAGNLVAKFRSETSRSIDELKRAADLQDLDRELRTISKDLRDVRSSVSRALREEGTTAPATPRDDDLPAPFDPDAT